MNISDKSKEIMANCRFCWMCRHVCPIGNATGLERNTAKSRALGASLVVSNTIELKEVADNMYECTLCGACTNNCMTGWDPKVFIQECKTEIIMNGVQPDYITALLDNYQNKSNVYGKDACACLNDVMSNGNDTLFFAGQDAILHTPESVLKAIALINKAGVNVDFDTNQDSANALWFLTGKTAETKQVAEKCAKLLNQYETVIVYDPVDLSLMLHQYNEWGIEIKAQLVSFNKYLLSLIEEGKLNVKKSNNEYSLQDNYAYARELDDSETGRKLIEKVGKVKDMLLIGKEANLAGQLIMREYMPEIIKQVALDRWTNAINMDCKTIVTENPAEYICLKETVPSGYRVITVEQMIEENL